MGRLSKLWRAALYYARENRLERIVAASGGGDEDGLSLEDLLAEATVYLDAEDLAGPDNTARTSWPDKNGGAAWSMPNATIQEAERNGLKAVFCHHWDSGISSPVDFMTGATGLTTIFVGHFNNLNGTHFYPNWDNTPDAIRWPGSGGIAFSAMGSTTRKNVPNWDTIGANTWHTETFRSEDGYWDFRTNGVQRFNTATNTFGLRSGVARQLSYQCNAYLGKFLAWDRVLTDEETSLVENFLKDLYATP